MAILPIRTIIRACAAVALLTAPIAWARADQGGDGQQTAYQAPINAPIRLQVTGSAERLSIDAERADVLSTLRSVLKQSGKQFTADAAVTGQVTLLLSDQTIDTILKSICTSCYLKYTVTPDGIYKFSRDDAAVKQAFTQLKELNVALRSQLRMLGLDIPVEAELTTRLNKAAPTSAPTVEPLGDQRQATPDRAFGAGRAGSQPADGLKPNFRAGSSQAPVPSQGSAAAKRDSQSRINNVHADFVPQGDASQFLSNSARQSGTLFDYGMVLRQNGFVYFNIPDEKPQPVASVLQMFSQQAGVPILLDQSIPNGLKFRVWGSLSPRQLPEALNVLAPTAHLQWRWIGNTIFVVPAPNFSISFGDGGSQRSAYPPSRGDSNLQQSEARDKKGGAE